MTWVRIDDRASTHRKQRDAGPEAAWLWVCGLCWCNGHHTNGEIRRADLVALSPGTWNEKQLGKLSAALVSVGLWIENGSDFIVHDYDQYQSEALRENVEDRREYERSRKAAQRAAKNPHRIGPVAQVSRRDMSGTVPGDMSGKSPPPVPSRPVPSRPIEEAIASSVGLAPDRPDVVSVFDRWRTLFEHPKAKLDAKRSRLIAAAIKSHGADMCLRALEGYSRDPFTLGTNDRHKRFDEIELLLKDAQHIERGCGLIDGSSAPVAAISTAVTSAWSDELLRLQRKADDLRLRHNPEEATRVDERRRAIESAGPERWAESKRPANGRGNAADVGPDLAGAQREAVRKLFGGSRGAQG
jgi:hypothetical protein